ncbi:MAG: alanine racemase [Candidatus Omnitrophota bacterium]|nr:alanine racemase [Candidatus Omnitrophota bacterium]
MMTSYRPTWAEINLNAIKHNLNCIRGVISDKVSILAVVKANAYGHGICPVSKVLVEEGVDYLGVATVDEALTLRKAGILVPILVLGAVLKEEAKAAVKHDITLTLCSRALLQVFADIADETNMKPKVHVKIDTGMGRIGIWHEEAVHFMREVYLMKKIEMEGIYTHFSSAARDKMVTQLQIEYFDKVLEDLEKREGICVKYRHSANSIAVVDWKSSHLNMVRPGILLYGVYPKEDFRKELKLNPVMSLKTKIVHLKEAPPGRAISYGRTYITQKWTKIATIPIGYADGYGRILSNKAEALIRGQYVRIVGMVTMDQTLLDVGHIENVQEGDEVVLVGRQVNSEVNIEKIAKLAGTIPYEILSAITDRVPRVYTR